MSHSMKAEVAYLKGLAEGINVGESSAEGKVLLKIIDVLDGMAEEIDNIALSHAALGDFVESIDEDLQNIEEWVFDEEDDYFDYDEEDEELLITCPECDHEFIVSTEELLEEGVYCPECGEACTLIDFVEDEDQYLSLIDGEDEDQ